MIENRDTFDSFWKSNELLYPAPYKYVIYGCGKAIEERILWINDLDAKIEKIEYFGDLDPEGVNIPKRTNKKLIEHNYNQRIIMALPFYLRLIKLYKKKYPSIVNNVKIDNKIKTFSENLNFLPEDEKRYVQHLFMGKKRISQELLNRTEILNILKNIQ